MAKSPKHQKQKPAKKRVASSQRPVRSTAIDRAVDTSTLPSNRLVAFLLLAFCFVLYGNTLTHQYTQDDAIVIYDNMYTTQGIGGIPGILKYDTFKGFFKVEGKDKLVSGGRYRPFSLVLFAVEWQLFKKAKLDENGRPVKDENGQVVYEGRPFIGHLINILFYGWTVVMVFLWLQQLLAPEKRNLKAFSVALIAALIFAAHPLHTEAVANIKGRDEILTLLGGVAAAYFSFRAFYENKVGYDILAFVLFFLALMSKENAITFLAVVPLAYWFFTKASMWTIVQKTWPFVGATIIFLAIRTSILGFDMGDTSIELMNNPFVKVENGQWVPLALGERMATIIYTLGKYVQLLFFPHPLTHDYYPRHVEIMQFANPKVLLSLVLYIGMAGYAFLRLFKKDPISFAILFFLATTSIISNIVFPVGTNMSERFMFMPSVGFALALGILGWRLAEALNHPKPIQTVGQLTAVFIIAAVVTLGFSVKTVLRNFAWKDNYTLFTTDIATSTNSAKLQNAVGGELITQSAKPQNKARRTEMLREAQAHLKEAIRIHPTYKGAYLLLGNSSNFLEEYGQAIQYYNQVLAIAPNDQNGYNNLGITYRDAGKFYGQKGDLAKADQYLKKALEMRGEEYEVLRLLGVLNGSRGNHAEAVRYFQKALAKEPNNATALLNLGNAYTYLGDQANAEKYIRQARAIDPNVGTKR